MKSMEMLEIGNCSALMVTEKQNSERYALVFSKHNISAVQLASAPEFYSQTSE
jgi:hypothetical protein